MTLHNLEGKRIHDGRHFSHSNGDVSQGSILRGGEGQEEKGLKK